MNPAPYTGIDVLEVMVEAKKYNRYLFALINNQLGFNRKVLDFGAGIGTFALPLLKLGVDVVCVEPDAILLDQLREAGALAVPSLAEVADGSIDFAYTFNVLEHISDDGEAVRQLAGKLKYGGRLLVYVPAFNILFSAMDRKVGHHRRYRRKPLVALLACAGLRVREAGYVDSLGFFATLAYRAFGSDTGDIDRAALKIYDRWVFPLSRALDTFMRPFFGKNLAVLAERVPLPSVGPIESGK